MATCRTPANHDRVYNLRDLTAVGREQHRKLGELYRCYVLPQHRLFRGLPALSDGVRVRGADIERICNELPKQSFLPGAFASQGPSESIFLTDTGDGSLSYLFTLTNPAWSFAVSQ